MATDTVILRNDHWESVTVEVFMGNEADPEANASLGTRNLALNEDWTIYSEAQDIFYRRDNDPDYPDGTMTDFTHRPCYGNGETYEESI